jgi:hypothetical protein
LRDKLKDASPDVKTTAGRELLAKGRQQGLESMCPQCFVGEKRILGSSAKSSELGISPYTAGEIFSPKAQRVLEKTGGMRGYSFADFRATHIPSLITLMKDLKQANKGLGVYSKNLNLLEIAGDTGIKFNISSGKNPDIGIPIDIAYEYTKRYPNAGVMYVGINMDDISSALKNKKVHKIIPAHPGPGVPAKLLTKITPETWENFQKYQNETIVLRVGDGNKAVKLFGKVPGEQLPAEKLAQARELITNATYTGDAQKYLQAVKEASNILGQKVTEKFPQFSSHPGYSKLIGSGPAEYGRTVGWKPLDVSKINIHKAMQYFTRGDRDTSDTALQYRKIADTIIKNIGSTQLPTAAPTAAEGKVKLYRGSDKEGGEWWTPDKEAAREYAGLNKGGKITSQEFSFNKVVGCKPSWYSPNPSLLTIFKTMGCMAYL